MTQTYPYFERPFPAIILSGETYSGRMLYSWEEQQLNPRFLGPSGIGPSQQPAPWTSGPSPRFGVANAVELNNQTVPSYPWYCELHIEGSLFNAPSGLLNAVLGAFPAYVFNLGSEGNVPVVIGAGPASGPAVAPWYTGTAYPGLTYAGSGTPASGTGINCWVIYGNWVASGTSLPLRTVPGLAGWHFGREIPFQAEPPLILSGVSLPVYWVPGPQPGVEFTFSGSVVNTVVCSGGNLFTAAFSLYMGFADGLLVSGTLT